VEPGRPAASRPLASWWGSLSGPFGYPVFVTIWLTSLIANFGSLVQAVGASWLMTSLAPSPDMVSLVQTASTLPIMLLALLSGVSADIWDRRMVMLVSQILACIASVILTVLAFMGGVTPLVLLAFTFLVGCGTALFQPAYQSSVTEQVPRSELSAAIALESFSLNLARTAGPAIGGLVVLAFGSPTAFLINSLTYPGLIMALAFWRREKTDSRLPPERMLSAIGSGLRFARRSEGIRRALIRSTAFGLLGSPIWALLPLVAKHLLGGGAGTYGALLGAFGMGAVFGALGGASIRLRYDNERIIRLCTLGAGAGIVVTALSPWQATTMAGLVLNGACWVAAVSTFNVNIQTLSPRWVVGRTVALFHTFIVGGLALGSYFWGLVAAEIGLSASILVAGSMMAGSVLLGLRLPLHRNEATSFEPLRPLPPDYQSQIDAFADRGPVVVTVTYRVAESDIHPFLCAMHDLRELRRRDGARNHMIMQDASEPEQWVETYRNANWIEHLRHHHRLSVSDERIEQRVLAFHRGPEPPRVAHLIQHRMLPAPGAACVHEIPICQQKNLQRGLP
jgi:MFS family permease